MGPFLSQYYGLSGLNRPIYRASNRPKIGLFQGCRPRAGYRQIALFTGIWANTGYIQALGLGCI